MINEISVLTESSLKKKRAAQMRLAPQVLLPYRSATFTGRTSALPAILTVGKGKTKIWNGNGVGVYLTKIISVGL